MDDMNIRSRVLCYGLAGLLAIAPLMSAPVARAAEAGDAPPQQRSIYTPSGEAMLIDTVIARPVGLAMTIVGTGLFVITLPFSIGGGNVDQARERFIDEPAAYTFRRCLGCFEDDHRTRRWGR